MLQRSTISSEAPSASTAEAVALRGPSYRLLLILSFSALVILTGLSITLFAFSRARASAEELAVTVFQEATGRATAETRQFVLRAPPVAKILAHAIGGGGGLSTDDQIQLGLHLAAALEANPGFGWVSYGHEQGTFTGAYRRPDGGTRLNLTRIEEAGRTRMVEYDVDPGHALTPFRSDDDFGYDPRRRPFYEAARRAGRGVWMPPYMFYNPAVSGVTYAEPVLADDGALRGVVTVDFNLAHLSELARRQQLSPNARLMIFTPTGEVLAHPAAPATGAAGERLTTIDELEDPVARAFFAQLRPTDFAADEQRQRSRHIQFTDDAGAAWLGTNTAFALDPDTAWAIGVMAPRHDFLAAVEHGQRISLVVALACVVGAMLLATALARHVSGPVLSLTSFMRRVGAGQLDERASFGRISEFRRLSDELNRMIDALREGSRMRAALAMANEVQQGLLPHTPPAVPGLHIAAHSTYCDETGGDYFDFLPAAPDRPPHVLTVACGDVTGHGVAAALLMAGVRGILRSHAPHCPTLAELLGRLNEQMTADRGSRFMTLLLLELDAAARTACWACAGHDPPIVYDPATDAFSTLEGGGLMLGVLPESEYEQYTRTLAAGHVIVIATDGVWEAGNPAGEVFGKDRLRSAIRTGARAGPGAADVESAILADMRDFTAGVRSRDDVTLVVLRLSEA